MTKKRVGSDLSQPPENSNERQSSEQRFKQMMRDPRYWRDQDPTFVDRGRKGFKDLYPKD